ncbi:MAG: RDD family protein [Oligoflexia bacterium]|nr:RDD family protein [Oligoflexia bacterium]
MHALIKNSLFVNRLIAKAIDLILVIAAASIFYPAGPLAAFLYILIADGFKGGQSVGKRLIGLRVVNTETGKEAEFKDSVIRNSTVAIPVLFFMVPIVGWFLWIVIGIPVLAIELYLMTRLEQQARLGDTMADTKVSEIKDT